MHCQEITKPLYKGISTNGTAIQSLNTVHLARQSFISLLMGKEDRRGGTQPLSLKFYGKAKGRIFCEEVQVATVKLLMVAMC